MAGIFRPLVILPRHLAESLSPDQLRLIFAHELAHVRRLDNLVLLGQQLVEAVFFFHPVTWLCRRALRLEAEKACDDAVLRRFPQPARYADSLARVAELCSNHSAGRLLNTLAATESRLGWRIARILEVAPMPRSRVVTIAAAAVLSLAGCLGLPGFMHDPVQQLSRTGAQAASGDSLRATGVWWEKTQLIQNAPNPFSHWTEIHYTILEQQAVPVKLELLNAQGERVFVLDNHMQKSSKTYVRWDGQDQEGNKVPPGVYFYRLTAGNFTQTREMLLVQPGEVQQEDKEARGLLRGTYTTKELDKPSVEFEVPKTSGHVQIGVWDQSYNHIYSWPGGALEAGTYKFTWDSRDEGEKKVGPGDYFIRLEIDDSLQILKYTMK